MTYTINLYIYILNVMSLFSKVSKYAYERYLFLQLSFFLSFSISHILCLALLVCIDIEGDGKFLTAHYNINFVTYSMYFLPLLSH